MTTRLKVEMERFVVWTNKKAVRLGLALGHRYHTDIVSKTRGTSLHIWNNIVNGIWIFAGLFYGYDWQYQISNFDPFSTSTSNDYTKTNTKSMVVLFDQWS